MARNLRLIESLWRYGIGGNLARFGCNLTRSVYLTLDRMVPTTDRAIAYIRTLPFRNEGMVCVVRVWWDRGDSDNKRSASGDVTWEHSGPRGWTVDVGGYFANEV